MSGVLQLAGLYHRIGSSNFRDSSEQAMTKSDPVTQDFLDSSQYQNESIQRYESVYGEDFVSPGGRAVAREMITRMALKPGSRVLDVGCGLGGSAFVMASEFGLRVEGIDLSKNMLALAQQKLEAHGLANEVSLAWGRSTTAS